MRSGDSAEAVARRYDRLARFYRLVEALFALRPRLKRRAVDRLALQEGDRVLEIGCGTGRNLAHLVGAVGAGGEVVGIDVSEGMLARAWRLCDCRGWRNVSLIRQDASALQVPGSFDGVLFCLSYSVLTDPHRTLAAAWALLGHGGRLVIMDAGLPDGLVGRLLRPSTQALSKITVLGDPDARPWDDLASIGAAVTTERFQLGTYYICQARRAA